MKIILTKNNYTLKVTHKELKVIERALNYMDNHTQDDVDIINEELFDCDEFKSDTSYEKFESKMWLKIVKKLKNVKVY